MEFNTTVRSLAERSRHASKSALTEEATKTSVVLPFIKALGFDIFNLDEVVPEFIADIGTKKGEKVDFALKIDGKIAILIEVKPISTPLGKAQFSQLYRYFAVTEARLAILTNGKEIRFFSDVDEPNKMDKKPFFTFDLQSHDDSQISELARFQKSEFLVETILEAASNLKYTSAAAGYIKQQLETPDEEFIKLVGRQIYDGAMTKTVVEQLRPAIQSSLDEVIRDRIQDKLNVAFRPEAAPGLSEPSPKKQTGETAGPAAIVTTGEEIQAFLIVRAIAARLIKLDRITMRDSKSYCGIFVDDNNRKPVCLLYFNSKSVRYVGLFDSQKQETRQQIEDLTDIYKFTEQIEESVKTHI